MELDTKESGMRRLTKEMERDPRYGLMALFTRDTGRTTKPMAGEG
jgi:hypothetical protein